MNLDATLSLCAYQTAGFTLGELDAIEEYRERLTLRGYFDLEELLEEISEPAAALRGRAEELTLWHDALTRLMADPRLENARRRENPSGPRYDKNGKGPYCAAVARFLRFAAEDYHRHRQGFEYAVTVWALEGIQAPVNYPPESRRIDLNNKILTPWD
ncbi:hypothetical protein ACIQVO_36875 [Streptomyces sp. NPDC101062]|uniref:hypothetical protein n=1 Tax=unclassified Streptomyces TaxID=2593676 RepID=UPI0038022C71